MTALAEKVKPNAVLFRFDQLTEPISQLTVLGGCEIALKHAELHPLPVGSENLMELGAALIFRDVVGDDNVHGDRGNRDLDLILLAPHTCSLLVISTLGADTVRFHP